MTKYLSVLTTNIARKLSAVSFVTLICLGFAGIPNEARAQSFLQAKWGPVLSEQKGNEILHTFALPKGDFVVIRENKRRREGLIIERISGDSLNVVNSKPLVFPTLENSLALYYQPLRLGDKTYLLATADDPSSLSVFIVAFELLENLDLAPSPRILGAANRAAIVNKNGFIVRADTANKVVSLLMPMEFQEGKNEKFEIRLFDEKLQLLFEKQLEVPHSSENLIYSNMVVDSLNALFVLTAIADPSIDTRNGRRNLGRDFSLFKYNWATQELSEKSLSLGTKWLYDVKMYVDDADRLKIAGYYSNMIDLLMAGTFSLELDRFTSEVLNQGISAFDRDFRSALRPQNSGATETELGMFNIDQVFEQGAGNVMIVSEKTYTSTSTIFNPATGTYSVVNIFNFDEILITSMSEKSKISFALMVPKFQSSVRGPSEYISYCSFRVGDKTYLVYNDHEKNAELGFQDLKGIRQLNSLANALPVLVSVDNNGKLKKEMALREPNTQALIDSRFLLRLADGVVLTATSGSNTQYLKLLFE